MNSTLQGAENSYRYKIHRSRDRRPLVSRESFLDSFNKYYPMRSRMRTLRLFSHWRVEHQLSENVTKGLTMYVSFPRQFYCLLPPWKKWLLCGGGWLSEARGICSHHHRQLYQLFPSLRYQLHCTDHGLDLIAVKCYFQGLNFFEVRLSHDVFYGGPIF